MMKVMKSLCARVESAKDRRPVAIAFLGDSVTHGCFEVYVNRQGNVDTRYRPDQGYPARLKRRLDLLYPAAAVSVINAGISGDNAPGGLARLERDVLSFRPDLVVVGFALNDCMNKAPDALMTYRGAMGQIMDRVLESGAECLILTPNFMNEYLDPALPQGVLRDIAQDTMRAQRKGCWRAMCAPPRRRPPAGACRWPTPMPAGRPWARPGWTPRRSWPTTSTIRCPNCMSCSRRRSCGP